jgi:hypothetical protein
VSALDIFALFVLCVLLAAVVAIWALLGMLPGRIARQRDHPQADAIAVAGWWGVITLGILLPLAWIWAYTKPVAQPPTTSDSPAGTADAESAS